MQQCCPDSTAVMLRGHTFSTAVWAGLCSLCCIDKLLTLVPSVALQGVDCSFLLAPTSTALTVILAYIVLA